MKKNHKQCIHLGAYLKQHIEICIHQRRVLNQKQICKNGRISPNTFKKVLRGETPNLYAYYAVLRELIPFIQEECKEDRREMLNELLLSLEKDFEARTRT